MHVQIIETGKQRKPADVVVLPFWEDKKKPIPAFAKADVSSDLLEVLKDDFLGKAQELLMTYQIEGKEKRVLLLGIGKKKHNDLQCLRRSFASATQLLRKKKIETANVYLPEGISEDGFSAILDGILMANYSFDQLKRECLKENPSIFLKSVHFIGGKKNYSAVAKRNAQMMDSVNLTRDLVNGNADEVQAHHLAETARTIAKQHASVSVRVLGKKELEKEKMGLILAVNRGAAHDPALIILHYKGDPKSKDWSAVVGKGITYDTGGLNIKPTGGMETMKADMAGGAAVLGIIQACASLGIKQNVIGVIASAENAVGPLSYKPGDVYISHSGRSVEISNTDAEGRLVLADALSYVQKQYAPNRIIDLATLTGGIVIALGEEACGLFSNNEKMAAQMKEASKITGERVWELPLFPEYKDALKSSIADIKNAGSRKASSATGATFLKQFVESDTPWVHLDIAGTAYLSETSAYHPSLATGFGVKLVCSFLENLQ
jgi:leucyl aminopeptidase